MDYISRRYAVLAALQALMGGVIIATIGVAYYVAPGSLKSSSLTIAMGGCAALAVLYYLSIHQLLKKSHLKTSTITLSLLSSLNIFLVIAASGGLDSPYYALWLLAIVVAGFFGSTSTILVLVASLAYFGFDLWQHGFSKDYLVGHAGELLLTITTTAVAEWVHLALGRNQAQHETVTRLTGKLSAESLKSEALMENVGEGVLVVNSTRQIQLFNPAAVRLTGWDVNSALSIDYRLVLNIRDASGNKLDDNTDPFTQVWRTGKSLVRNDLTMETKGGHKVAISLSLSPIMETGGQMSGGIALFRDISDEKEVERQRNEFISTASHEMRTPVAAVEGYLSLAMNPAVATIDERAKGYLDKAHSSTKHLGDLFRDLLAITKIEDNHEGGEEIFDLGAMAKDAVDDMRFEADKKHLEMQFAPSDQRLRGDNIVMPVYAVKANPQRVREVIMNLLENAIKFTPQGTVRLTIGGTNDAVTLSVIDSGIGISAEDIGHLFQKFYRVDNSSTRTIGGTGLGLYLCRSIIEKAGGKIWVDSKLGEGSAFRFNLPRLASDKIKKGAPKLQPGVATAALAFPTPVVPAAAAPATLSPASPVPSVPRPVPSAPSAAAGPTFTDIKKPVGVK